MTRVLLLLILLCSPALGQTPNDPGDTDNSNTATESAERAAIENLTRALNELVSQTRILAGEIESIAANTTPDQNAERRRDGYQYDSVNLQHSDLARQDSMAKSTFWMAVAAGVGTVISIWGVYLLVQNLGLTQTIVTQNRAYMTPGDSYVDIVAKNELGNVTGINVRFNWINSGDSPALEVKAASCRIRGPMSEIPPVSMIGNLRDRVPTNVGRDQNIGVDFFFSRDEFLRFINKNDDFEAVVYTIVEYSDIYGNFYRNEWTSLINWGDLQKGDLPNVNLVNAAMRYQNWGPHQGETAIGRKPSYPDYQIEPKRMAPPPPTN